MSGEGIKVFGVGGSGGHTLEILAEKNPETLDVIAVNTDAFALLDAKVGKKIIIGKDLTGGTSAGSDVILGDRAARMDAGKISEAVDDARVVFITCGLGGGTGSGASPVIAERARQVNALTVSVVTYPFDSEGRNAAKNAKTGLRNLKKTSDAVIVIPNKKLLEVAPGLPIKEAFRLAEKNLADIIWELANMIQAEGSNNLSLADLRSVLTGGATTYVGLGEAESLGDAVKEALSSPFLDLNAGSACGALLYVTYSPEAELIGVEDAVELVASRLPNDVGVIWGAREDEGFKEGYYKALLILCQGQE